MTARTDYTLINPATGNLAFKIFEFDGDQYFQLQRTYNYYSILLIPEGAGKLTVDFSEYPFEANTLMCFAIYQPFIIKADGPLKGILINFHPDFFCIHKHQHEVSCNGILFNNIFNPPTLQLQSGEAGSLLSIIETLKAEMQITGLAQYEMLVSYLKIFLINATRFKVESQNVETIPVGDEPFILKTLKDAIEEHYRKLHAPGDYADMLNISTRALNKLSKAHFNRTLSNLISERLIIEAKRELYLTSKPVKTIAYELGFEDEFYFSRFFKHNAEVSPNVYRSTVGFARAEV